MRFVMSILFVTLVLGGCKKKEGTTGEGSAMGSGSAMAGSSDMGSAMGSGSAAGSGSDMSGSAGVGSDTGSAAAGSGAGSGSAEQVMAHHAGNCPSTVLGSVTKAELKGKEVVVTITSDDADAVKGIQKRTDELLAPKKDAKPSMGHDQKGAHGGGMGLCPVYVPEGAKVTGKHEKKGVMVTITPKDKPDALKTEIDARIQRAADWVKTNIKPGDKANEGGVGGGSGDDGMNHSGSGDAKGIERKKAAAGSGGGKGTGGGGGKGTGGGGTKNK